jgi:predicted nucleic acid-binding protein
VSSYVLDASVAAKWLLPAEGEPLSAEAMELAERYTTGEVALIVPDLFWIEIANILWKAQRIERVSAESAEEALQWAAELAIPTYPSETLLRDAFTIAVRFQRTVYDCIYIALAISTRRPLITADKRLFHAVGAELPVRWVGAF